MSICQQLRYSFMKDVGAPALLGLRAASRRKRRPPRSREPDATAVRVFRSAENDDAPLAVAVAQSARCAVRTPLSMTLKNGRHSS